MIPKELKDTTLRCRHIKILRELKMSEMTDEEMLKVAVDKLQAKAGMLIYMDRQNTVWWFGRYKNKFPESRRWLKQMEQCWEKYFKGKLQRIKELV